VVEPPPGVVPGVGAGVAGGVVEGAGVLAPGVDAGAAASSFLLQALSATASTEAIIKVLLIIFGLL
jgi:predicted ATP-dependent serine protease